MNTKILVALTVYISALFMSNLLGLKTIPFFFDTHLSIAVFTLPFVFITTDVIGKVYGKDMAKKFVFLWFLALWIWSLFSIFAQLLPWSDNTYARIGESYEEIFTLSIRVFIASLVAFLIAEYLDVLVFFRFKNNKSTFFTASTLSNIVSQFLDTAIFMTIAFYGVFETSTIISMAIPWWIYKVSMWVLYMPLSYLVLHHFWKHEWV